MAVTINFLAINVNAQDTNATVSIGEIAQNSWNSHNKNNFGNGMFFGAALTPNNLVFINDNDFIDMPVGDNDNVPSAQNQSL
ncbi:spore germination protein [Paenibacillus hexagrammi]|uniref:Spore germination protein n=1 Tax=Paenibacillus hexagrammi TaxID=2908839 RepID=A0ABY3SH83_9BACL|nr:spore germination protein [Paenibacillus sp. YPD9-1]UJF32863.1 spore germination protein [Paenibacillus sp. YPD9-1]